MSSLHPEIIAIENELNDILSRVEKIAKEVMQDPNQTAFNEQILAEIVKHLCIRISAYLQQSFRILVREYAKKQNSPILYKYLMRSEYGKDEESGSNPTRENIIGLLNKLDTSENWSKSFKKLAENNDLLSQLDDFMRVRNKIAHQGRPSSGVILTVSDIKRYYSVTKEIVSILAGICI
ncbi:MAG: HEPN domain-containing protein [bacterium]|nr:HEPN domain-containing protein [bacterium]